MAHRSPLKLLALITNIRLDLAKIAHINGAQSSEKHSSLFCASINDKEKSLNLELFALIANTRLDLPTFLTLNDPKKGKTLVYFAEA